MADTRRTILNAGPMFARPLPPSGGGVRSDTVVVASTTSSSASQAAADFVCDTYNAFPVAAQALATLEETGGSVVFLEGGYRVTGTLFVPRATTVRGVNREATLFQYDPGTSGGEVEALFLCFKGGNHFADFTAFVGQAAPDVEPALSPLIVSSPGADITVTRCDLYAPNAISYYDPAVAT